MVKCEYCGREMTTEEGCSVSEYMIDGRWYPRIRVGNPGDMMPVGPGERCHDCNAAYGEYHHPGCDSESCPKCGMQVIFSCDCDITHVR